MIRVSVLTLCCSLDPSPSWVRKDKYEAILASISELVSNGSPLRHEATVGGDGPLGPQDLHRFGRRPCHAAEERAASARPAALQIIVLFVPWLPGQRDPPTPP